MLFFHLHKTFRISLSPQIGMQGHSDYWASENSCLEGNETVIRQSATFASRSKRVKSGFSRVACRLCSGKGLAADGSWSWKVSQLSNRCSWGTWALITSSRGKCANLNTSVLVNDAELYKWPTRGLDVFLEKTVFAYIHLLSVTKTKYLWLSNLQSFI